MKDRIEQLDGLRGIFAVMVIAHHHNAFRESIFYNNFFVINASLFVDFFFVLSGFVIALNYVERIHSFSDFGQFLKKRFIRLYPLLFYTEIVFVIANLLGDQTPVKNVASPGVDYYFYPTLDTITFMGSTPVFGSWIGNNYPSWSISAEMIAYVVFGLTILALPKLKYWGLGVLTILSGLFIYSRNEYLLAYDYGFIRGILCFSLGVFTHLLLSRKTFKLTFLEFPFLILLLAGMYAVHSLDLNLWKMAFPFFFAWGIIIFASSGGPITKTLASPPFQYLGKVSYSIYLNHALVLILVNVILFRLLKLPGEEWMIGISLLVSIGLTILYSHFTYQWIELRFSKFLRSKWR